MNKKLDSFDTMFFPEYPKNDGTIICFTGADVLDHMHTLRKMGAKACKVSFFGFTQRKYSIDMLRENLESFEYVVVEPGMGSVRNAIKKHGSSFSVDKFVNKYYDFCMQIKDIVHVFLAYDFVTQMTDWEDIENYVYQGKDMGLHIAPTVFPFVNHKILGDTGYLENFDIVSMPFPDKHWKTSVMLAEYIHSKGVKLHGHSISSVDKYRSLPLFSADTSAWLAGQKFGTTYKYVNGNLQVYNVRDKELVRPGLYAMAKEHGLDIDLLRKDCIQAKDDYRNTKSEIVIEVNSLNLISWMKYAEYVRNPGWGKK